MKEILPIGSVVTLNGGNNKIMIIGYLPVTEDGKLFDYNGCIWPLGVLSSDRTLLFNHEQIVDVVSKGYENEEQQEFAKKLKDAYEKSKLSNDNKGE
jgi:hypothetical protein